VRIAYLTTDESTNVIDANWCKPQRWNWTAEVQPDVLEAISPPWPPWWASLDGMQAVTSFYCSAAFFYGDGMRWFWTWDAFSPALYKVAASSQPRLRSRAHP
jgi:hypothetical protein